MRVGRLKGRADPQISAMWGIRRRARSRRLVQGEDAAQQARISLIEGLGDGWKTAAKAPRRVR